MTKEHVSIPHRVSARAKIIAYGAVLSVALASLIGLDFEWRSIEPQPGVFDWQKTDAALELARRYNAAELSDLVYHRMGLLALSDGQDSEMLALVESRSAPATFAMEYFCLYLSKTSFV